ncbi:hypothetical protein T11_2713 [Trichinella zimbabwensis]|uniref:Uncharacterized protein n=1 Tax=Trichinella zimbabwensis TaxID=268475 RepID=A0A0V1H9N1_9BILA|nr:hypothetical protein T11_2713 [Trichinella zimbabwensis]
MEQAERKAGCFYAFGGQFQRTHPHRCLVLNTRRQQIVFRNKMPIGQLEIFEKAGQACRRTEIFGSTNTRHLFTRQWPVDSMVTCPDADAQLSQRPSNRQLTPLHITENRMTCGKAVDNVVLYFSAASVRLALRHLEVGSIGRKIVDDKSKTVQHDSHIVNSWINDQEDDDDSTLPTTLASICENIRANVDCVRKIEEYPDGSRKMTCIANTQLAGSLLIKPVKKHSP